MNGGLSLFERKGLGCIFGAKQGTVVWQKRYNYELHDTFNEPDTVNYSKVNRLA
jgi:TolB-like protein